MGRDAAMRSAENFARMCMTYSVREAHCSHTRRFEAVDES